MRRHKESSHLLAWFLIVIGAVIAGLWSVLLTTGGVPELEAGDREIWVHLVAELTTAVILATSGVLMLRGRRQGALLGGVGLGALLYTTSNSAGFYANRDEWITVTMFLVLAGVAIFMAVLWMSLVSDSGGETRDEKVSRVRQTLGGS